MPAKQHIVNLEAVSYAYPKASFAALKDVSLNISEGEFVGLIGPSGAGKSTLCKLLNGIVPQFHGGDFWGEASLLEHDLTSTPISQLSRYVGSVFQDPETQLVCSTVELEAAFVMENLAYPRDTIIERVRWALGSVGLSGYEQTHPGELSGGQQQRLALAAVLAVQPRIVVLDEPTSQLDPLARAEVFQLLDTLRRETGITILIASHAHEELAMYASHIVLMDEGRIQRHALPGEIYSDSDLMQQSRLRCPEITIAVSTILGKAFVQDNQLCTLGGVRPVLSSMAARLQPYPNGNPLPKQDSATKDALIVVDHISVSYPNGFQAINNLSFSIHRGEFTVVLGRNGSGKSTLLKTLLNLLTPEKGEVRFRGRPVTELKTSELAQSIAYVPQNPDHQIFNSTVEKEVRFALENLGLPESDIAERANRALEQMGLHKLAKAHPLSLPRGERSRLVIAAVLATEPEVILLDEPTVGQDHAAAIQILDVAKQLQQAGIAVVVVTHHLNLLPGYATRCMAISEGSCVFDGSLQNAFSLLGLSPLDTLAPTQTIELARLLNPLIDFELNVSAPGDFIRYTEPSLCSAG